MNSDPDKPFPNQPAADDIADDDAPEIESKSQRKRNAHQITALAAQLVAMKPKARAALPIEQSVLDAITHCADIKAHGARKRQLHFVSKLLREADNIEQLQFQIEHPELTKTKKKANQHQAFRDDLLNNFAGQIDDLRDNYPSIDLQQVRQLVRNAHKECAPVAPETEPTMRLDKTKAAKTLMRLLTTANH